MKGQRFWWMIARFKQHIYRKRKGFLNRILLISCCLFFLFKKSMEKERKLLNQHLLSFKIRRKIIRKAERIWRIWVIQKVITVSKIQKSDHPMLPRCSYEKIGRMKIGIKNAVFQKISKYFSGGK